MNDGARVQLAPGEPIERTLTRFKRQGQKAGLLGELRRRAKRARAVARQRKRAAQQDGR